MTRYVSLAEYLWLAEQVTGVDAAVLSKASRVDLADSALHAPAAGHGDQDFYPDLIDKASGSRAGWLGIIHSRMGQAGRVASLVLFLDLNGLRWDPDPPDTDAAETAMLAVAAHEVDEEWLSSWMRERVRPD